MEKPIVIRQKGIQKMQHNAIEKAYWITDQIVCGIDEAGRGPLAGPVVAAAVVIPIACENMLLKDSKILSEKARNKAYHWILQNCHIGIGIENHTSIDTHNIYQATLRAMQRAFCQLTSHMPTPMGGIIVDAMPLTFITPAYNQIPVHAFIKAESLSSSVAAASIVAKVVRDSIMNTLELSIPGYALTKHKGYGTAQHQGFIHKKGRSLVHRNSFLLKIEKTKDDHEYEYQRSIWRSDNKHP